MPCAAGPDLYVHPQSGSALPRSISSLLRQASRLQVFFCSSSDHNNHLFRVPVSALGPPWFLSHSFFVSLSFLFLLSLASQEEITLTVYLFASLLL